MAVNPMSGLRKAVIGLLVFSLAVVVQGLVFQQVLKDNALGLDYFIFWKAGRAFFFEGRNPYTSEVTLETQMGAYGHPANFPLEDPLQFNYPVFALFATLPEFFLDYPQAQAYWLAFNITALLGLFLLAFPNAKKWVLVTVPLFYNYAFGMIVGNFPVLMSAILALFYGYFVSREKRELKMQIVVGILLAWCLSRPQAFWLYIIWVVLYAWRSRLYALLVSLGTALLAFVFLPMLFRPAWPVEWLHQLTYYLDYTTPNRPLIALVWPFFWNIDIPAEVYSRGYWVTAVVVLPLAAWTLWRWWQGKIPHLVLLGVVGITTYFMTPNNTSVSQLFLLQPVILYCVEQRDRAGQIWWAVFFVFSYLVIAAEWLGFFPHATMIWPFWFVAVWLAWLVFIYNRKLVAAEQPVAAP